MRGRQRLPGQPFEVHDTEGVFGIDDGELRISRRRPLREDVLREGVRGERASGKEAQELAAMTAKQFLIHGDLDLF